MPAMTIGYREDTAGVRDLLLNAAERKGPCTLIAAAALVKAHCTKDGMEFDAAKFVEDARAAYYGEYSARAHSAYALLKDWLHQIGLRHLDFEDETRPTFSQAHKRYGDCIAERRGHMVVIVGGDMLGGFDDRWHGRGKTKHRRALNVWVPGKRFAAFVKRYAKAPIVSIASRAAHKAWETRRRNQTREQISAGQRAAAHKAWETRRRNAA